MRFRYNFLSFFFFISFFFLSFFIPSSFIFAVGEQYDVTKQFSPGSAPLAKEETHQVTASENTSKQNLESSEQLTTNVSQGEELEFDTEVSSLPVPDAQNFLTSILKSLASGAMNFGSLLFQLAKGWVYLFLVGLNGITYAMAWGISTYWKESLFALVVGILMPGSFFAMTQPGPKFVVTNLLKSGADLHARLWVGLVAGIAAWAGTKSWKAEYLILLKKFENKTNWKVGDLRQDAMWIGGLLLAFAIVWGGTAAYSAIEAGTLTPEIVIEKVKPIAQYIVKETRSAFTETEKECKEGKCETLWEKGIILAFNYLPGAMPDLDIDDGVITLKKNLESEE